MRSPYAVLGVEENSSLDVCRTAYKLLARKYHPDAGGSASQDKFLEITKAWEDIKSGKVVVTVKLKQGLRHKTLFTLF